MLKSHSRTIEITHKFFDLFLINISWWASYYMRFERNWLTPEKGLLQWYLKLSILLSIMSYYFFRREGIYSSKRFSPISREALSVIKANTFSFLFFIVLIYFISENKISRLFTINYYFISTFLLVSFKVSLRKFLKNIRKQGKNIRFSVLIGNSAQIQSYASRIVAHPEFGIEIKEWFKENIDYENLAYSTIESLNPDSVIVGVENKNYHKIDNLLVSLNNSLFDVIVLPDLSHAFVGYQVIDMSGMTAILINEPNIKSGSVILKRLFDLFVTVIGLIIISPLLILIAALVKLSSKGPVLFTQIRMGLDGKQFKMYKFRSMTTDSTNKETWTVNDDPRVTPIGKFIRKTSLDEFPQLFNVLLGDMSLVGPRPERPIFVHQFRHKIPTYMLRHKMKAGMTGWAQVNGWRGDTSIERRIECDLYYIKHWSIWMDLWILCMTIWKGFVHKNAY